MDKKTAIEKIRKCLALANSAEPHEAAAALRQAQKLMKQFGVEHPELLAAGVCDAWSRSRALHRPIRYEAALARVVADAYGCDMLFGRELNEAKTDIVGAYTFIGIGPSPEIAKYSFDVLARKLRAARRVYIGAKLRRCTPRNKVARADEYCDGWVMAVRDNMMTGTMPAEHVAMISSYIRANFGTTSTFEPRTRAVSRRRAIDDSHNGYDEGRHAVVHRGVGKEQQRRLSNV
ncbi:DUF2786 domain-containing protein [Burkholderia perseverans]|uniref:DUF2786 domain-containing protein n=1 Tax=Burkholderia perseverans TaxID=2615214 RepID=UPI001FEF4BA7|nr:DUF2786 domain-containing protein [Burkholderia perseverans]